MQILIWIIRVVVVLLFVWFAAKNADPIMLRGYLDSTLTAPLALVLLAFFGGGLVLGLMASLMTMFRLKREIRKLNRALQHKTRDEIATLPPSSPAPHSTMPKL
jgi:lipopolysaccharide assembly protein A